MHSRIVSLPLGVAGICLGLLSACPSRPHEDQCFGEATVGSGSGAERFCGIFNWTYPWPEERDGLQSLEYTICGLDAMSEECSLGPCDVDELEDLFVDDLTHYEGEDQDIFRCYGENMEEFQPVCREALENLLLQDSYPDACCWSAVVWADCPPRPAEAP